MRAKLNSRRPARRTCSLLAVTLAFLVGAECARAGGSYSLVAGDAEAPETESGVLPNLGISSDLFAHPLIGDAHASFAAEGSTFDTFGSAHSAFPGAGVVANATVFWDDRLTFTFDAPSLAAAEDSVVIYQLQVQWGLSGSGVNSAHYSLDANGNGNSASTTYASTTGFVYNDFGFPAGNNGAETVYLLSYLDNVAAAPGGGYEGTFEFGLSSRAGGTANDGDAFGNFKVEFEYGSIELRSTNGDPVPWLFNPPGSGGGGTGSLPGGSGTATVRHVESDSGFDYGPVNLFGDFLEADFDENGLVDAADLQLWKTGFGTSAGATHGQGTANADGAVDGTDLLVWQRQLGQTPTVAATTAVPEPASVLIAVLAFAAVGGFVRGR